MIVTNLSGNELPASKSDLFKNPLFSLSDLYEPKSIYEVFAFCRKIVMTNEVVSAIMHKLAESPVTDLLYDHEDPEVVSRFEKLFEHQLNIRERFLELIFDLVTYSNAFVSLEVPVTRFLVSPNVGHDLKEKLRAVEAGDMPEQAFDGWLAERTDEGRNPRIPRRFRIQTIDWELTGNGRFRGKCPITGETVEFERVDRYYASANNVFLKRWDPNLVEIMHNEITGKNKYYYRMSRASRELIRLQDRDMFNEVPWPYIEAVFERRNVRIFEENFRHLSNVRISGAFNGWGVPRLYSAFRAIFYYMTLLRANQSIAVGKIHDLNILFPATQGSATGIDPAAAVPGANFARQIHTILKAHQKDPNFTGISPIPVGVTSVFGQGRMQLVSGEMEPVVRSITTALGLPYDMLYGGGAYTGQAVAQRVWSAQTGLTRERFNELIQFIVDRVIAMLGRQNYPDTMAIKLRPAEGPDAFQIKQTIVNMAGQGLASRAAALEQVGLEWDQELKRMEEEAKGMARVNRLSTQNQAFDEARAQEIMQRAQARLAEEQQQMMMANQGVGEEMMPEEEEPASPGQSPQAIASVYLEFIERHPEQVSQALAMAQREHPYAYELLIDHLGLGAPGMDAPGAEMPGAEMPGAGMPMADAQPEMLPARRATGGL